MYGRSEGADAAGSEITPQLSYLLCATPRSGSTLLSEALTRTGIAGRPEEHFEALLETGRPRRPRDYFARANDPDVIALLDDPRFRPLFDDGDLAEEGRADGREASGFGEVLERAIREGTTPNGVFGTKIMWVYFRNFIRLVRRTPGYEDVPPCEVPAAVFPNLGRYVWIVRKDTVRQAVSLWKALQTWRWREETGVGGPDVEEPRFSYAAINHLAHQIRDHNAAWQVYFERCSIEPSKIIYEELAEAYEESVLGLLEDLDIPVPEGFVVADPKMKQQADETSEEWVRLYHERKAAEARGRSRKG
jgi:LPS sulfotransferase NodH